MIAKLKDKGIEADVAQLRNDVFTIFKGEYSLPNMDRIEKEYLYIPIHTNMTTSDAEYIASTINEIAC